METEFSQCDLIADEEIYAKEVEVTWKTKDLSKTEIMVARNRKGIAVYNPERAKSDLETLESRIEESRRILSSGKDQKKIVNELGGLRSLVKSSGNTLVLNEKHIEVLKKIAGRSRDLLEQLNHFWRSDR